MYCTHAEADTALYTIYYNLRTVNKYKEQCVIDTEDIDNYVQAGFVANKIPGQLLIKRKKVYVDSQELYAQSMVDVMISLHAMSGSDHTSRFYGKGKKVIADRVSESADARRQLGSLGQNLIVSEDTVQDMVQFVIKYVYNDDKSKTPAEARVLKWKAQKKKNLQRIPPDIESLKLHITHANYISYIQRNFHLKTHASPLNHGWHLVNDLCVPLKADSPPLPQVVQCIYESGESDCETDTEDESTDGDCSEYWSDSESDT